MCSNHKFVWSSVTWVVLQTVDCSTGAFVCVHINGVMARNGKKKGGHRIASGLELVLGRIVDYTM